MKSCVKALSCAVAGYGLACLNAFGQQTQPVGTAAQSKFIQAVDEYVPAPGQFVNTLPEATAADTPATMAQKCTEAIANGNGGMITLGAWGGYVTFHFDHPVVNVEGQRDFAVWGNAFTNNAEPAVVMVSVDANGNGRPDDTWYELRGSEYANSKTVHGYRLTYTYSAMQDVAWTDNKGGSGVVARNSYHAQEYFPLWLASEGTLTFEGCRLPDNAYYDEATRQFLLPAYAYGYADNQPNTDVEGCSMDIGWAVDDAGQPVTLDHVDFIRCYNAMNQVCGNIGETSTEITGAEDLHPDASTGISGIGLSPSAVTRCYSIDGRQSATLRPGLNIVRMEDGTIKKVFRKNN